MEELNKKAVIKNNNAVSFKNKLFNDKVKSFFDADFSFNPQNIDRFLKELFDADYLNQIGERFTSIRYNKQSALKSFLGNELAVLHIYKTSDKVISEIQINSPSMFKSMLTKKLEIIDCYIHEATHNRQRLKSLGNTNEYYQIMSNSFYNDNFSITYLSDFCEIDARIEVINAITDFFKSKHIPLTLSTVYLQLQNALEIHSGLNLKYHIHDKLNSSDLVRAYETLIKRGDMLIKSQDDIKTFMAKFSKKLDEKLEICNKNIDFLYQQTIALMQQQYPNEFENICKNIFVRNSVDVSDLMGENKYAVMYRIYRLLETKCKSIFGAKKYDAKLDKTIDGKNAFEIEEERERE